jgi:hypothetical protein
MILHLPWFMNVTSVNVDGKRLRLTNRQVELQPTAKSVHITWTRRPLSSDVPSSYDVAVQRYKDEYARRYRALNGEDE